MAVITGSRCQHVKGGFLIPTRRGRSPSKSPEYLWRYSYFLKLIWEANSLTRALRSSVTVSSQSLKWTVNSLPETAVSEPMTPHQSHRNEGQQPSPRLYSLFPPLLPDDAYQQLGVPPSHEGLTHGQVTTRGQRSAVTGALLATRPWRAPAPQPARILIRALGAHPERPR